MIAEEIQNLLYDAVKIYNKYIGRDYLIIARTNPKIPIDFFQIRMKEENFLAFNWLQVIKEKQV